MKSIFEWDKDDYIGKEFTRHTANGFAHYRITAVHVPDSGFKYTGAEYKAECYWSNTDDVTVGHQLSMTHSETLMRLYDDLQEENDMNGYYASLSGG